MIDALALAAAGHTLYPSGHGEKRSKAVNPGTLVALQARGLLARRYVDGSPEFRITVSGRAEHARILKRTKRRVEQ